MRHTHACVFRLFVTVIDISIVPIVLRSMQVRRITAQFHYSDTGAVVSRHLVSVVLFVSAASQSWFWRACLSATDVAVDISRENRSAQKLAGLTLAERSREIICHRRGTGGTNAETVMCLTALVDPSGE